MSLPTFWYAIAAAVVVVSFGNGECTPKRR